MIIFQIDNLIIHRLVVGDLETNCYVVENITTKTALIIDPGGDGEYICQYIYDNEINPMLVIITHGHMDHILALEDLLLIYNLDLAYHKNDSTFISRFSKQLRLDTIPNVISIIKKYQNMFAVLEIIHIPGHTPGSICVRFPDHNMLFVGDLIFKDGYVGRTDFKYSNKDDLTTSIKRIKKLPNETIILPGHEDYFYLGEMEPHG